jgi:NAD(P)-dependent dehydrogenase (short-subunit alcohol dehydrogenase family)
MNRLAGKSALIIGGSSGIGQATALAFVKEGAKVVIAGRRSEEGEETVRLIKDMDGEAFFVKTDVTKAAEVEALVNKVVYAYGRMDIAFNTAGNEGKPGPLIDLPEEIWDAVIATNLKGVWLAMKYQIPQMLKQGGGTIVNTSSAAGLVGTAGAAAYAASKHGVVGLTKSAALEHAKSGIRINAVAPAGVETDMLERFFPTPEIKAQFEALHPVGRLAQPEEIARAVVWLCSDEASFVIGQALTVDGGYTAQ